MKKVNTSYYQSTDGQNVKRILVDSYLIFINEIIEQGDFNTVIQMGYGDGEVIERLMNKVKHVIVIEGDYELYRRAIAEHKKNDHVLIINSFFEHFFLKNKVDLVLGNHVLEHVDDPGTVLHMTRQWLKNTGKALFTVPNATSLHRRIGKEMGLLKSIYDLNPQDRKVGHQRVYDWQSFNDELQNSGYKIIKAGGFNIKLTSQKQMKDWSHELLRAIFLISLECQPQICSNLYAICRN